MSEGLHNASYATPCDLTRREDGGSHPVGTGRKWKTRKRFIYVATDEARVKVGSSANPAKRVAGLGAALKRPVRLLRVIPLGVISRQSAVILEDAAHRALGRVRRWDGEWYAMPADEAIARVVATVRRVRAVWRRVA